MADDVEQMNAAFERVLETFQIDNLKDSQREVLEKLVSGLDVFVVQPTGSGKSLIFQSAPIVFDTVRPLSNAKSIALVISPLASLMQDQVWYLKPVGIRLFIGDEQKRPSNWWNAGNAKSCMAHPSHFCLSRGGTKTGLGRAAEIEPSINVSLRVWHKLNLVYQISTRLCKLDRVNEALLITKTHRINDRKLFQPKILFK